MFSLEPSLFVVTELGDMAADLPKESSVLKTWRVIVTGSNWINASGGITSFTVTDTLKVLLCFPSETLSANMSEPM